jgi:hypothetical protein
MGDSFTTSHPRQLIALDRHGLVLNRAVLARLRGYFNSASRVELHGCYVAEGPGGFALLQALHTLWGVPVSAGISEQNGGTVGLDGPKMTVGAIGRR